MIGYCTNVHSGADLAQTRENLERYAVSVRERFSPGGLTGVGLWLSARSVRELLDSDDLPVWRDWLASAGLVPYTFNGFPYGDFHSEVVKGNVYSPTWAEPSRYEYTRDLIEVLDGLLPAGQPGSISTLPVCWGNPTPAEAALGAAADNLRRAAADLAELEARAGRQVCLCLEPEPGCYLGTSAELVRFFEDHLLPGGDEAAVRRHLKVCHDVCHADVMFEGQAEALAAYRAAGVGVGKVQVSSAVRVDFDSLPGPADRAEAFRQLSGFDEPRYLHQTSVRGRDGGVRFFHDLSGALVACGPEGEWRVHFHVPVYLERFGLLEAMPGSIRQSLAALAGEPGPVQYEVETYAWGVLPEGLQVADLSEGIARELAWLRGILADRPGPA